tara:strand:- start:80231 stop:81307 length:1077 start_codon:yes stop_codon:yes gene_type:complete
MRLAFYAPMKPPDHAVASGDRQMAQSLVLALQYIGAKVTLASRLRSRDGAGDTATQRQLSAAAAAEIPALIAQGRAEGWQAWITYHNYYKAPDLLGPAVAGALSIPYLQVESTRSRSRLTGPWAAFAKAAEAASDAADAIFYLTARDAETLRRDAPPGQRLIHLPPFLTLSELPAAADLDGPMLCVGMMRAGDKLASYRIIADTLALLPRDSWQLQIAGDGPERAAVGALMGRFGTAVHLLGALDAAEMARVYGQSSLLFWPGVNEAFGMVYLEAAASGLPIVAQDRPGVRDVLPPAPHPAPDAGASALAARLAGLNSDAAARQHEGAAARAQVAARHLMLQAAATLARGLADCGVHG